MAGFYSELFARNPGKVYFDMAVLSYEKCTIRTLATVEDAGEVIEITVGEVIIQAIKYPDIIVVEVSELIRLGEIEQELLVSYEQTPEGRREKTEVLA